MCGIIGTTNLNKSEKILKKGLLLMTNRGPDFYKLHKDKFGYFGHTRLAIIDLESRSNQPFEYKHNNKSILLTFNGEIYNYLQLRKELINKGYQFLTNCDTEVIAASFIEWGNSCFDHFIGMWALAIFFDEKIILARDRVGKKPLYYSISGENNLSFSSSIKSLSLITSQIQICKNGTELYFALGFVPKNYTILKNVFKLEPGHIKVFEKNSKGYFLSQSEKSTFQVTLKMSNLNFHEIFKKAVELRNISDVPIATLMSGGIDSTIVSVVTKSIKPNIESFFVDFENKKFSESKWVKYLSRRNNIKLSTFLMNNDDLNNGFKHYYQAYEEPFADYSGIPSIAIFKKISKSYKVVLTGDGGDELFYGYPHYLKKLIIYKLFSIFKLFVNTNLIPKRVRNIVSDKKDNFESNYLKNHGLVTQFSSDILNKQFNKSILDNNSFLKGIIDYDRTFYNLPEKYLVKVDRASMYSSVEVRSPFMDESLLYYIKKLPIILLFTPFSTKLFLKIKYFKIFGIKYFFAKKSGFTPPIQNLRNKYFNDEDFNFTKKNLKVISTELYSKASGITFDNLKKIKFYLIAFSFFING